MKLKIEETCQTIFMEFKKDDVYIEIARIVPRDQNQISKESALRMAHAIVNFYEEPCYE